MTVEDQQAEQEKASAQEIIASAPLFEGVQGVEIELGDDHTGDPAMWLVFKLRADLNADWAWCERFNDYSTKLSLKILHSGVTRFPYHRLQQAA